MEKLGQYRNAIAAVVTGLVAVAFYAWLDPAQTHRKTPYTLYQNPLVLLLIFVAAGGAMWYGLRR